MYSSRLHAHNMAFCGFDREHFREHFEEGKLLHNHVINFIISLVTFFFINLGIYVCAKCGNELFESTRKFDHPSAWPAFSKTIKSDSVSKEQETATAFRVSCNQCGKRLGHEFLRDGPSPEESRF